MNDVLTRAGVEDRIMALTDNLERRTYEYESIAREAAEAEADYREKKAHAAIAMIVAHKGSTVAEREARADLMVRDEQRRYLLTKASRDSAREHLTSIRGTLDALRTLSASVRAQT